MEHYTGRRVNCTTAISRVYSVIEGISLDQPVPRVLFPRISKVRQIKNKKKPTLVGL